MIAMPKVTVNDIQMYYEVTGKGFPLVMINGLSDSLDCWDPRLIEALSKKFELVLFDNRDVGRTDMSKREYTMKTFADDTVGLMNALGISKANVLGISMGGMIAQELVLNYPETVTKLVLCSTGNNWCFSQEVSRIVLAVGESSPEELTRMIFSLNVANDFPRNFLKQHPFAAICFTADFVIENPELVTHIFQRAAEHPISKEGWRRQLSAIRGFNTQGRLQQIRNPTLVLHGSRDIEIPPENGSTLAQAIPNAKLVYFDKSAHYLAEQIREVINVLSAFLD
jgi:3-oxoadipate enol-lactonase